MPTPGLSSWIRSGGTAATLIRLKSATAAVHTGLAPVGAGGGAGAGWARSQFEDCALDDMWEAFQRLSAGGFTGKKLRIVMAGGGVAQVI